MLAWYTSEHDHKFQNHMIISLLLHFSWLNESFAMSHHRSQNLTKMCSDWETPKCILCEFLFPLDLHEASESFFLVNFLRFFISRWLFFQICRKVHKLWRPLWTWNWVKMSHYHLKWPLWKMTVCLFRISAQFWKTTVNLRVAHARVRSYS